ncbi:hypothetical protein BDV98DRAFT_573810 [Pterulicium gracile]|uniref:Ricin B lectin domain-containing protein n=1 Tax=Pterulicium gracile TaxID=1884261 RepID=A0A5C3QC97_9AGAR|nr:hypothetical protein BDV98DRAFT_573810 [Pterula gracilis]
MIDYSQIKTYVHGMPAQPINQHTPIDIVAQEDGVLHLLHALPHLTTRSALYDWPKSRDEWINSNHIKSRCVGASGGVLDVGSAVTIFDCNGTVSQKWAWWDGFTLRHSRHHQKTTLHERSRH